MEFSNGIIETAKKPRKQAEAETGAKAEDKEISKLEEAANEKSAVISQAVKPALKMEEIATKEPKE